MLQYYNCRNNKKIIEINNRIGAINFVRAMKNNFAAKKNYEISNIKLNLLKIIFL